MRLAGCLQRAVAAGQISQAFAAKINARVQELLGKGFAEGSAMAKAAAEAAAAAREEKRQLTKRILAAARAEALAASHPKGFGAGVRALLARDLHGLATYSNIEGRARAIRALAHADLAEFLDRFRAKYAGLWRDQAGLERFVRALYGQAADADAARLAKAWDDAAERLRRRFVDAGGSVFTFRQTWRLPQPWDPAKVRAAGKSAWLNWMEERWRAGELRVRDPDTGLEVDPLRRAEILSDAYDRIASEGLSDLTPGAVGGTKLADRRAQARAFEWTSPEAYLRFLDEYGVGRRALYELLNGHIDGMARDIALLEILGPNPEWTLRRLIDQAKIAAGPTRAAREAGRIERLWAHVSGAANTPEHEGAAALFRETRAFLTAAQLGAAFISSASDFATLRQVTAWNGASFARALRHYLRLMNPANADDRRLAVRTGLLAEAWAQRAAGAMRDQADVVGTGLGSRLADFIMRISLLSPHTQAGRWAVQTELLTVAGEHAARRFDDLPEALRRGLTAYGITPAEWDLARRAGVVTQGGLTLLSPAHLARGADPRTPGGRERLRVATKLLEWTQGEARFAIPEPGAAERAVMLQGTRPGTLAGEFLRSVAQYKSFPVTVMLMHVGRGLNAARGGDWGRYLVSYAIAMTATGALALQMKQIAGGRDPRDMTDWRFWGAAFAQGGGAGLVGDFMYSAIARTDQDFYAAALGGPIGGLASDLAKVLGLNLQALDDDRRERALGADLARLARRYAPGTSLWYTRLAVDRLLWDALQDYVDPEAPRRWRQLERRVLREYGQEFWWAPGESGPRRAPAWQAAVGGEP